MTIFRSVVLVMILLTFLVASNANEESHNNVGEPVSSVHLKISNESDKHLKVTIYAAPTANDYTQSMVAIDAGGFGVVSINLNTPTTFAQLSFEVGNAVYFDGNSVLSIVGNAGPQEVLVSAPCSTGDGLFYTAYASGVRISEACAKLRSNA